jgi:hypothetical protein
MMSKAEWKDRDFNKNTYPPENAYVMFKELTLLNGDVIARLEVFVNKPTCFYVSTPNDRGGWLPTEDLARQWCETKTGNKVN